MLLAFLLSRFRSRRQISHPQADIPRNINIEPLHSSRMIQPRILIEAILSRFVRDCEKVHVYSGAVQYNIS